MKISSLVSTFALAAGLAALALPASADHRGGRDTWRGGDYQGRQGGAVLYSNAGFRGEAVRVDGAVPSLGRIGFNDRASSIVINRGVWEVCVDANFRGRCEIIDTSAGRLNAYRLNDNISSLRPAGYDRRGRDDRRSDRDHGKRGGWDSGRGGQGLILFPDSNQRGPAMEIGQDVSDLSRYRFNDKASSFYVSAGTWQVCEHANYRGRCEILTAGAGDLRPIRMNDNISSIRRYRDWR
ncbi:beta/gamma crystallin family protein [Hyphomonas adhaerens MHS-3]|uniref:Beta/gamma crystallin family protein n=1 Tax=Hyphomonas adhaerens MHS-3 TaxID=1280949 RepID=A0A069E464_9PROT|nr:beta/gamma crystallin-related protein [Hyphomonas adhaerens]KCZ84838.1 beta/gamma crystallin family protein [Hyphomonas adhaerens MHS-3]